MYKYYTNILSTVILKCCEICHAGKFLGNSDPQESCFQGCWGGSEQQNLPL